MWYLGLKVDVGSPMPTLADAWWEHLHTFLILIAGLFGAQLG